MILIVLIIAAILRFYQLGSLPPALDWDEVSNAYNGYSILKTGRDEFGQSFPILFRAYDGYVPPVLVYLNSASTAIFGLGEFAARFPNALLGTLTVWGIYLLVAKLHPRGEVKTAPGSHSGGGQRVALLAALFLAITPWHIIYSRINVFATTPIFFVVFATYFFLLGFSKFRYLTLSTLFFILAIFSYFSAYIFVPLFVLALVFIFRKQLLSLCHSERSEESRSFGLRPQDDMRGIFILASVFFSAFLILFLIPGGQNRLRGISIFNDPDTVKIAAEEARGEGLEGRILHNRRFVYAQEILKGYFVNFRGDFLFANGDAVERMVVAGPGFGLLLVWFLPFLIAGVFHLVSEKPKGWTIWILWLLLAPIAAATSLPQPVSTRTTLMSVPLVIITAYGFYYALINSGSVILRRKPKNLTWILRFAQDDMVRLIVILLLAFNLFLFLHQYFVHFAIEKSDQWFYGYRQLFDFLNTDANQNRKIHFIFKQHENLDQIHMFTLFYNKVDPATWQANGGTRLGCGGTTGQFAFDRYDFIPISCLTKPVDWESYNDSDLIVTSSPTGGSYLEKIEYLDGRDAFYVYQYRDVSSVILDSIENPDSRFPLFRQRRIHLWRARE